MITAAFLYALFLVCATDVITSFLPKGIVTKDEVLVFPNMFFVLSCTNGLFCADLKDNGSAKL